MSLLDDLDIDDLPDMTEMEHKTSIGSILPPEVYNTNVEDFDSFDQFISCAGTEIWDLDEFNEFTYMTLVRAAKLLLTDEDGNTPESRGGVRTRLREELEKKGYTAESFDFGE